jgi:hypothetical protein
MLRRAHDGRRGTRVLSSLNDLTRIEAAELDACLVELAAAIRAHRERRAAAIAEGTPASCPSLVFTHFVHRTSGDGPAPADWLPTPDTGIEDLPLPQQVISDLADLKILRLADLSAASRQELRKVRQIGNGRLALMEHWLRSAGLGFLPEAPNEPRYRAA